MFVKSFLIIWYVARRFWIENVPQPVATSHSHEDKRHEEKHRICRPTLHKNLEIAQRKKHRIASFHKTPRTFGKKKRTKLAG